MRTRNAMMIEEVLRVTTMPLDFEQDREIVEEVYYEAVNPEEIEDFVNPISAETAYTEQEFNKTIQDILESLTPREAKTLKLRFGIGIEKEYSLEEVAKIYGLTRERIRQIEAKALRKLRHPSRSDRLQVFIQDEAITLSTIAAEPFPNMDDYWGVYGIEAYIKATDSWNMRVREARMKLEKLKIELKQGTLI